MKTHIKEMFGWSRIKLTSINSEQSSKKFGKVQKAKKSIEVNNRSWSTTGLML